METWRNASALRSGTLAGMVLSAVPNIGSEDLWRTAVLAAVGAAVSFTVTFLLRLLAAGRRKKK